MEMGLAYAIDCIKLKKYKPACHFHAHELTVILR
jgi:hypothetical protein